MRFTIVSVLLAAAPLALAQSYSSAAPPPYSASAAPVYSASSQSTTTLTSTATMTKTITVSEVVASVTSTYAMHNSTVTYPTGTGVAPVPTYSAKPTPSPIASPISGASSLKGMYAGSVGLAVVVAAAFL